MDTTERYDPTVHVLVTMFAGAMNVAKATRTTTLKSCMIASSLRSADRGKLLARSLQCRPPGSVSETAPLTTRLLFHRQDLTPKRGAVHGWVTNPYMFSRRPHVIYFPPHMVGSLSYFSVSPNRPPRPPSGGSRWVVGLGALGSSLLLLGGKAKYALAALKLTKFATLGSMVLSVGTYAMFFGFPYAVGMVGLMAIHEAGHALVMYRLGIPFSPMLFVPFLGATIAMSRRPRDAYEGALVAFGGPVLGSLGAAGCAVAANSFDSQLLYALAHFGYMVNLFNLLPVGMLDGGRICGAISPYAHLAGLGIGGTLVYQGYVTNPIFYLVLLTGGYETFQRFFYPDSTLPPNYYRITSGQRMAITGGYFGLVGALIGAMALNSASMKSPKRLKEEARMKEQFYYD